MTSKKISELTNKTTPLPTYKVEVEDQNGLSGNSTLANLSKGLNPFSGPLYVLQGTAFYDPEVGVGGSLILETDGAIDGGNYLSFKTKNDQEAGINWTSPTLGTFMGYIVYEGPTTSMPHTIVFGINGGVRLLYSAQLFRFHESTTIATDVDDLTLSPNRNVVLTKPLRLASNPPAAANSTGVAGTITWDASFIYICTATNTWKRVAISTW